MQIKNLYKFKRSDGGTSVSLEKPEKHECSILFRLIADEGKALTNDCKTFYPCIDVDSTGGWSEVECFQEIPNEEEYQ